MEYLTKCNTKEGSNGESIEQDIKMKWQKWAQILPYQQLFKMSMYKMLQLKKQTTTTKGSGWQNFLKVIQ